MNQVEKDVDAVMRVLMAHPNRRLTTADIKDQLTDYFGWYDSIEQKVYERLKKRLNRALKHICEQSSEVFDQVEENRSEHPFYRLFDGTFVFKNPDKQCPIKVGPYLNEKGISSRSDCYIASSPSESHTPDVVGMEVTPEREFFVKLSDLIIRRLIPDEYFDPLHNSSIENFYKYLKDDEKLQVKRLFDSFAIAQREYPLLAPGDYTDDDEVERLEIIKNGIFNALRTRRKAFVEFNNGWQSEKMSFYGVFYKAPKYFIRYEVMRNGKLIQRQTAIRNISSITLLDEESTRPDNFYLMAGDDLDKLHFIPRMEGASPEELASVTVKLRIFSAGAKNDLEYFRLSRRQSRMTEVLIDNEKAWEFTLEGQKISQAFVNYLVWMSGVLEVVEPEFLRNHIINTLTNNLTRYHKTDASAN